MNILLLQGPLGPFFSRLGHTLRQQGHQTYRIVFNGGDRWWAWGGQIDSYRDAPAAWEVYLRRYLRQHKITQVICYGDCRFYHKVARHICEQKGIPFYALEEGYLRPDYITLEQGGVNAGSPWYDRRDTLSEMRWTQPFRTPLTIGRNFRHRTLYAIGYHLGRFLLHVRYRHYCNHRPWNPIQEALGWINTGLVKLRRTLPDRHLLKRLTTLRGRLFLVPLQVAEDFQLRDHSDYPDMQTFICEVIDSFARHAPADTALLFKHHPMDRGYVSYQRLIADEARARGVSERVFYGHQLPLPPIYRLLRGVVTINSTVGLSALLHHIPTLCLGKALYDVEGLTTPGPLNAFWGTQLEVCPDTFDRYRESLLHLTQLNGSFYNHLEETCHTVANHLIADPRQNVVLLRRKGKKKSWRML